MTRGRLVLACLLAVLLVLGGVTARVVGTGAVTGAAPLLSPSAVPPGDDPGPATVELSLDALAHPSAAALRDQLQRHFHAINARDYAAWTTTVSDRRAQGQPEDVWRNDYASTADGTIRIDRIDDLDGGQLLARVRFVSSQLPTDAPEELPVGRICWRISFPVSGDPLVIDPARAGSSARTAC